MKKVIHLPSYDLCIKLQDGGGEIIAGELDEPQFDSRPEFSGILRMLLAHAIAGVDVESPAYLEGLETAVEGICNDTL